MDTADQALSLKNTSTYLFGSKLVSKKQRIALLFLISVPLFSLLLIPLVLIDFCVESTQLMAPINGYFLRFMQFAGACIGLSFLIIPYACTRVSDETGKIVSKRPEAMHWILTPLYIPLTMLIMTHFAWRISNAVDFFGSDAPIHLVPYKIVELGQGKNNRTYPRVDPFGTGFFNPPVSRRDSQQLSDGNGVLKPLDPTMCYLTPIQISGQAVRLVLSAKPSADETRLVKCP